MGCVGGGNKKQEPRRDERPIDNPREPERE